MQLIRGVVFTKTVTILIVDDENFVCENLKLKLNRLQHKAEYKAVSCNSVKQALLLMENESFDIVFTDIRMPFVGGHSFIKQLREKGFSGKLLVLSGYDDFDDVRMAFLNGADDYLLKPVSISQLDEKLINYTADDTEKLKPQKTEHIDNVIEYAKEYILLHYADSCLDMAEVASHISISYSHFSNLFRKETGTTFPAYLLNVRIEKAIELLNDPSMKIGDICYKVGFKYPQQFSRDFKKITGVYPSDYPQDS